MTAPHDEAKKVPAGGEVLAVAAPEPPCCQSLAGGVYELSHTAIPKRGMETATSQLDTRIRLRCAERLVERQGSGDALELDRS